MNIVKVSICPHNCRMRNLSPGRFHYFVYYALCNFNDGSEHTTSEVKLTSEQREVVHYPLKAGELVQVEALAGEAEKFQNNSISVLPGACMSTSAKWQQKTPLKFERDPMANSVQNETHKISNIRMCLNHKVTLMKWLGIILARYKPSRV